MPLLDDISLVVKVEVPIVDSSVEVEGRVEEEAKDEPPFEDEDEFRSTDDGDSFDGTLFVTMVQYGQYVEGKLMDR